MIIISWHLIVHDRILGGFAITSYKLSRTTDCFHRMKFPPIVLSTKY